MYNCSGITKTPVKFQNDRPALHTILHVSLDSPAADTAYGEQW